MTQKKHQLSSSIIPQSNYRKFCGKPLNELNATIPPIGKSYASNKELIGKIKHQITIIHSVIFKKENHNASLQKKITTALFEPSSDPEDIPIDKLWARIELPILNFIKVYYLDRYIETLLLSYEQQVKFLIGKYKRHLPQHVSAIEGDDLTTIAQLELIETFKAWHPEKNIDIWPLAYTRINGAMKDHIRYISKSDPTRFYDWINNAANVYLAINENPSYEMEIETSVELERALKKLTDKEKKVVILYVTKDLTFNQISKKINISESQVSRIYKKAIQKIKSILK
jgi:RNA polymerase sigma factor (sigma-70 family)